MISTGEESYIPSYSLLLGAKIEPSDVLQTTKEVWIYPLSQKRTETLCDCHRWSRAKNILSAVCIFLALFVFGVSVFELFSEDPGENTSLLSPRLRKTF